MSKIYGKNIWQIATVKGGVIIMSKIYGYARVSTTGQYKQGNSIENQVELLRNAGCTKIFEETYTGTKKDRPILKNLLKELNTGDTLVVTKLDRLARTAVEGVTLVQELLADGINVNILNMGMLENSPVGKLILTIMLAYAEFERDLIIERTQEGKEIAKKNPDYREGRPPKFKRKQVEHALELLEEHTYREVEEITGISKSTLIRAKRKKVVLSLSDKQ